jgi:uncharacterized protein (DUF58 family)
MQPQAEINEAVEVSVPLLVRLNREAAGISLRRRRILAHHGGDYQSPFRGRGMEYDESRPYQPGDDIRNIDWRVTARTGRPHTKLFREERERPVYLWADLRRSMFFATRGCYKAVTAARAASLLAWSAAREGDRIGGVIFSDHQHNELKPHRGKTAVLRFINRLAGHPAWSAGQRAGFDPEAGGRALLRLRRVVRPGSLIFLLSDFRGLDERAWSQMTLLSRHNDLVLVFIYDPLERDLPPPGLYRIDDGEGEAILDSFDAAQVEAHRRRFDEHLRSLEEAASRAGMFLLSCSTTEDPLRVLQAGLAAAPR